MHTICVYNTSAFAEEEPVADEQQPSTSTGGARPPATLGEQRTGVITSRFDPSQQVHLRLPTASRFEQAGTVR